MRRAVRTLSLKARAMQYLAQREHSRMELRRKLLPHALKQCAAEGPVPVEGDDASVDAGPCLDKLLDWLEGHQLLSEERFVESRVHARAARFGGRRIAAELAQHGVALPSAAAAELKSTEFERAQSVWARKFGEAPADAAGHARQVRFLMMRGFSSDAVRQVLDRARRTRRDAGEGGDSGESDRGDASHSNERLEVSAAEGRRSLRDDPSLDDVEEVGEVENVDVDGDGDDSASALDDAPDGWRAAPD